MVYLIICALIYLYARNGVLAHQLQVARYEAEQWRAIAGFKVEQPVWESNRKIAA